MPDEFNQGEPLSKEAIAESISGITEFMLHLIYALAEHPGIDRDRLLRQVKAFPAPDGPEVRRAAYQALKNQAVEYFSG